MAPHVQLRLYYSQHPREQKTLNQTPNLTQVSSLLCSIRLLGSIGLLWLGGVLLLDRVALDGIGLGGVGLNGRVLLLDGPKLSLVLAIAGVGEAGTDEEDEVDDSQDPRDERGDFGQRNVHAVKTSVVECGWVTGSFPRYGGVTRLAIGGHQHTPGRRRFICNKYCNVESGECWVWLGGCTYQTTAPIPAQPAKPEPMFL